MVSLVIEDVDMLVVKYVGSFYLGVVCKSGGFDFFIGEFFFVLIVKWGDRYRFLFVDFKVFDMSYFFLIRCRRR